MKQDTAACPMPVRGGLRGAPDFWHCEGPMLTVKGVTGLVVRKVGCGQRVGGVRHWPAPNLGFENGSNSSCAIRMANMPTRRSGDELRRIAPRTDGFGRSRAWGLQRTRCRCQPPLAATHPHAWVADGAKAVATDDFVGRKNISNTR